MRQIIWTCVVALLGACDIPADVKSQIACTTLCTCFVGPIGSNDCVDECIADGEFAQIPDDCFECIQTHANQCSTLESDCEPLCEQRPPPPDDDFPDGGMQ
jgi:hypothetical protein